MTCPRRQSGGFTLLEILVATSMMAVLTGSFYATLRIAFTARSSAATAVAPVRKLELAMTMLREDLQSAVIPRGLLAGPLTGEDMVDAQGKASDVLTFHCTVGGWGQSTSLGDIQKVELLSETPEDTEQKCLVRRVTVNLLASQTEEAKQEILCRGIEGFNLRYFDGVEWQDQWDSTVQDNVLPLAIEVTIQLAAPRDANDGQEGYSATRVFSMPCSSLQPGVSPGGQENQLSEGTAQ